MAEREHEGGCYLSPEQKQLEKLRWRLGRATAMLTLAEGQLRYSNDMHTDIVMADKIAEALPSLMYD